MRAIGRQYLEVWKRLKSLQKGVLMGVAVCALGCSFFILKGWGRKEAPLFPSGRLAHDEVTEVRRFLREAAVPYKEKRKGVFLVPKGEVGPLQSQLDAQGIPKHMPGKGFELFDANTWIKGDKELQVLEMRALKGQLERDLATYDAIKSASVILDLAPPRLFGGEGQKTKASVIVTLKPGARLSLTQKRAITNHLAGAVRGLEPSRVAISDTTGRLYQAIDPEEVEEREENLLEESLQKKIEALVAALLGQEHGHVTVHVVEKSVSVALLLDERVATETKLETLSSQLAKLLEGYPEATDPVITCTPFPGKALEVERNKPYSLWMGAIVALVIAGVFFLRSKKEKTTSSSTSVNLHSLADAIKEEDPDTIAHMVSYLDPERAERLIDCLPEKMQEEVLAHLTQIELEGR